MKKPRIPPDWLELMSETVKDIDRFNELWWLRNPIHKGRYIHWDKLQHLEPPEGLTKREWWISLKLARQGQNRELPLQGVSGKRFHFYLPDIAIEYLHHIDLGLGGGIEMPGEDIANSKYRDRYIAHSIIEEAITSSQLEGAATTRKEAKRMISTERRPRDRSEQMILNNYKTMCLIRDRIDRPLSKELVFEFHRFLTEDTLDDSSASGRFRNENEQVKVYENTSNIVLHDPPLANQLDERMEIMCAFANETIPEFFIPPVVRAIMLHFWLAYDHPFVDGNGRCARALFYWLMLRKNYWLCEFISISQIIKNGPARYGRAFLHTETDDNDMNYFILYHLNVIQKAIDQLNRYIIKKTAQINETEELLRAASINLNHRQYYLLSHSLRHPDAEYTVKSHQKLNNIVYETARKDLFGLTKNNLLSLKKRGKEYLFFPFEDLARKLKANRMSEGKISYSKGKMGTQKT